MTWVLLLGNAESVLGKIGKKNILTKLTVIEVSWKNNVKSWISGELWLFFAETWISLVFF